MIAGIGMTEILVILSVVMVLFGAKKLPELGEGMGKGIRSFKKAISESDNKTDDQIEV